MQVDLRSNIDAVYHQGSTGACGPHSVVNALEAMHDNAGTPKRFSRAWLYHWAQAHAGRIDSMLGTDFDGLASALSENGAALESEWPWDNLHQTPPIKKAGLTGITLKRTLWNIDEVKRLLCLGVPVVFAFNCQQSFYDLRDQKDWRTHSWDSFGPVSSYDHYVCIVGYDDAAQRFLVENSWGPEWGDGGFFGFQYGSFRSGLHAFHVDRIYGFHPRPVEGFMTIPYLLTTTDNSEFTFGNKQNLIELLTSALSEKGPQGVIDTASKWRVSDKHIEHLFRWDRGTVRKFQEANPSLNWAGFMWATL